MKQSFALLIILFTLTAGTFPNDRPEFSYKAYGNIANYFESEKDLLSFFEFTKGDVVAEVGANNGQNIAGLSILTDSITFYAEDIDAKSLNEKDLLKTVSKTGKYKKVQTNTFKLQIGTEKETLLPDSSCNKIILSSTFHEFTYMDDMINDLYNKLKPGGKLYILESKCYAKTHKNYSAEETIAILNKHLLKLLQKDGKNLTGATGLFRLIVQKPLL